MAVKAYQPVTARSVANSQATTGPLGTATWRALKLPATCVGLPPLKLPSVGSARGVAVSYFGKAYAEEGMSFSLGIIDGPTGLELQKHIFVADKGDYYKIADNVPQREQ